MRKTKRSTHRMRSSRRLSRKIRGGTKNQIYSAITVSSRNLGLYGLRLSKNEGRKKETYIHKIDTVATARPHVHVFTSGTPGAVFPTGGENVVRYTSEDRPSDKEEVDLAITQIQKWIEEPNLDAGWKLYFTNILIELGHEPPTPAQVQAAERESKHDKTREAIQKIVGLKNSGIPEEIRSNVYLIVNNLLIAKSRTLTNHNLVCKSTIRTLKFTDPKNLDVKIKHSILQIDQLKQYINDLFNTKHPEPDADERERRMIDNINEIRRSKEEVQDENSPTMDEILYAFRILCLLQYCNDKKKYSRTKDNFSPGLVFEAFDKFSTLFNVNFKYHTPERADLQEINEFNAVKQRILDDLYEAIDIIKDDPDRVGDLNGLKVAIKQLSALDITPTPDT